MRFGPLALDEAEGAVLAHALSLPEGRLRKGQSLDATAIAALRARLAELEKVDVIAPARFQALRYPEGGEQVGCGVCGARQRGRAGEVK